jgi:hypothetical protein
LILQVHPRSTTVPFRVPFRPLRALPCGFTLPELRSSPARRLSTTCSHATALPRVRKLPCGFSRPRNVAASRSTYRGFIPSSRHHRARPPTAGVASPRSVPSSGFRNLSTAYSAHPSSHCAGRSSTPKGLRSTAAFVEARARTRVLPKSRLHSLLRRVMSRISTSRIDGLGDFGQPATPKGFGHPPPATVCLATVATLSSPRRDRFESLPSWCLPLLRRVTTHTDPPRRLQSNSAPRKALRRTAAPWGLGFHSALRACFIPLPRPGFQIRSGVSRSVQQRLLIEGRSLLAVVFRTLVAAPRPASIALSRNPQRFGPWHPPPRAKSSASRFCSTRSSVSRDRC